MLYPLSHALAPPRLLHGVSPFLPFNRSPACLLSFRSSSRRVRRIVVSLCRLSIQSNMRCGFGCLLAVAVGVGDVFSSRYLVVSRGAVLRFLLASLRSRLAASSHAHLIGHRLARRLPALRHGWAGRKAGSVCVLLAWFCPAGFADFDSRFMPFPLRCPLGLLACRIGCGGDGVLISSVRDVLRCHAYSSSRLVSSLVSFVVSSVGSVLRLSPRLTTRWAGRRAIAACYPFSVPISCRLPCSPVLAYLWSFLVPP